MVGKAGGNLLTQPILLVHLAMQQQAAVLTYVASVKLGNHFSALSPAKLEGGLGLS